MKTKTPRRKVSLQSLDARIELLDTEVRSIRKDMKKYATKDDIRTVIEHIDSFFVRDHRLKNVETAVQNHEGRLNVLEQRA